MKTFKCLFYKMDIGDKGCDCRKDECYMTNPSSSFRAKYFNNPNKDNKTKKGRKSKKNE